MEAPTPGLATDLAFEARQAAATEPDRVLTIRRSRHIVRQCPTCNEASSTSGHREPLAPEDLKDIQGSRGNRVDPMPSTAVMSRSIRAAEVNQATATPKREVILAAGTTDKVG